MMQSQRLNFTTFNELTKLSFTLFGLPFVFSGLLISFQGFTHNYLWVLPAFVSARSSGMAFNAWLDQTFDAKNARTQNRVLPSGRLSSKQAAAVAWGSLLLFFLICLQINLPTALLGSVAAVLISVYSLTKRFTYLCHYILGCVHLCSVLMAATLACGTITPPTIFLGLMALSNIAAFDIIWALQDAAFDQKEGLHSIPARFGKKTALKIAQGTHVSVVIFSALVCLFAGFSLIFLSWPLMLAAFLFNFYRKLEKEPLAPLFFRYNALIPIISFIFLLGACLCNGM